MTIEKFPHADRVWESLVPIYHDHLAQDGHGKESTERIIEELKLHHDRLYEYEVFVFDMQSLKDAPGIAFTQEQLNLVAVSANKLTSAFGQHVVDRMRTAEVLILHLLKQKHGK